MKIVKQNSNWRFYNLRIPIRSTKSGLMFSKQAASLGRLLYDLELTSYLVGTLFQGLTGNED